MCLLTGGKIRKEEAATLSRVTMSGFRTFAINRKSNAWIVPIDEQVIYQHLAGKKIVGVYPLLKDNNCHFLAVDFDKNDWKEAVMAAAKSCVELNIPYLVEISQSGQGAHLWVFFSESVPAKDARSLGFSILDKAMESYPNLSFDSYD